MSPNDADGMANRVDPDRIAPVGAVRSGSALFAQAYLSKTWDHYGTLFERKRSLDIQGYLRYKDGPILSVLYLILLSCEMQKKAALSHH